MTTVTFIATLLPLAAALGVVWYTFQNISRLTPGQSQTPEPKRSEFITVDELGRIECTLPDLVRVLVVANKIEKPEKELGRAVEQNFSRGVKYLFLISSSRAAAERDGYYRLFEAYAKIRGSTDNPLDIKALPFEWDDYPIIFYQTRDKTGRLASVAFRGNELLEGIATKYEQVPAAYAHTIATSLLADAPADIKAYKLPGRPEFDRGKSLRVVDMHAKSHAAETTARN